MYNAIGGLGGSGQLDSTVAANATVALLAATAASAITIVPPIFDVGVLSEDSRKKPSLYFSLASRSSRLFTDRYAFS